MPVTGEVVGKELRIGRERFKAGPTEGVRNFVCEA